MTAGRHSERDGADVEALIADHYLDALLSAGDRGAVDTPADVALDGEVRDAAMALRRALVRVHPSFRFEERLASRLADLAAVQGRAPNATGGAIVPFVPTAGARPGVDHRQRPFDDPLLGSILAGTVDPSGDPGSDIDSRADDEGRAGIDGRVELDPRPAGARRPLIVGGAITSAAISLVGVAWVAWRTARPGARSSASAMARAAQAAHARRLAAEALAAAGLSGGGIGGPA